MITKKLEELILCGKASYNTFIAGGTQKHILNVHNDRFIIITDITYFSSLNYPANQRLTDEDIKKITEDTLNTQVKIFSEKSTNVYLFRNNLNVVPDVNGNTYNVFPFGSVKHETYLVHESDVSISFSYAGKSVGGAVGLTITENPAFPPPYDYGKIGQAGALAVRQIGTNGVGYEPRYQGQSALKTVGLGQYDLQFSFPIELGTEYTDLTPATSYPILQIGYVEIIGNPTNLSMSI